jgi:hypothetical protein
LANTQTNQIVIGYQTTGLGSNTTVIGNASTTDTAIYGNLLLGGTTTGAGYKLNLTGTSLFTGAISTTETINMASPFMFRNKIINGAMTIDQRNGGAAITTDGGYPLDRFVMLLGVTNITMQKSATAPTGFLNSLAVTVGISSAMVATNYTVIRHIIEGINTIDLSWGTANAKNITLSFWVRSSLTGNFGVALRNSANNYGYVVSYNIPTANTWVYITKTITAPTTGTWDTAIGARGIIIHWDLGVGTSYSISAGSWVSATEILGLTGGVKLKENAGATFYLTGVQLEIGNIATPFEHKSYAAELQLCKRYFQRWGDGVMFQAGNTGASGGANDYFKMLGGGSYSGGEMAIVPTLSYLSTPYFIGIGGLSGSPSDLGNISPSNMSSLGLGNTTTAINRLGIFDITTYGGTRGWYYNANTAFVGLTAEI